MKEVQHSDNYRYLIDKLDAFIRRYYLDHMIRGMLFTTAVVAALFVSFSAIEYELYLDKLWRKLMFFSFIAVSGAALYFWVLRYALAYMRLGKRISYEEAARIIGRHFPEVEDKLLNILQLKKLASASEERELIEASIRQKSDRIKWVPFYRAVDLSVNRKYLKYALTPLILIGLLLFSAPEVLRQGPTASPLPLRARHFQTPRPTVRRLHARSADPRYSHSARLLHRNWPAQLYHETLGRWTL